MGLDMYLRTTNAELPAETYFWWEPDIFNADFDYVEVGYWRKCYNLNDWMATLYFEKGGESYAYEGSFYLPLTKFMAFNSCDLKLNQTDLIWLEQDIINGVLDLNERHEDLRRYTLDVIAKSFKEIRNGKNVFYRVSH